MSTFEIEIADGLAVIALDDPATLNALSPRTCRQLASALDRLADDETVRAAVLTGRGRAFCSGADLSEAAELLAGGRPDLEALVAEAYNPLARRLADMPFPLVAAVHGAAAGVGLSYALAADLIVASESAVFSAGFRKVGLAPDGGATWRLVRRIGPARAAEMALIGEPLDARTALAWGLINRVVADAELASAALALARDLASGPASLAPTAMLLRRAQDNDWETQLVLEAAVQGEAGRSADFREGVAAFIEKRAPRFRGR